MAELTHINDYVDFEKEEIQGRICQTSHKLLLQKDLVLDKSSPKG